VIPNRRGWRTWLALVPTVVAAQSTGCGMVTRDSGSGTEPDAGARGTGGAAGGAAPPLRDASPDADVTTTDAGSDTDALASGGAGALDASGDGTEAGGSAASAGTTPLDFGCADPETVVVADEGGPSVERCAGGFIHRIAPASSVLRVSTECTGTWATCALATDCDAGSHGSCEPVYYLQVPGCGCVYRCETDQDCSGLCLQGICVAADCRQDADCPPATLCVSHAGNTYSSPYFHCQQPSVDSCVGDRDCDYLSPCDSAAQSPSWVACRFDGTQRSCTCGNVVY
jgi:hypothetical protein